MTVAVMATTATANDTAPAPAGEAEDTKATVQVLIAGTPTREERDLLADPRSVTESFKRTIGRQHDRFWSQPRKVETDADGTLEISQLVSVHKYSDEAPQDAFERRRREASNEQFLRESGWHGTLDNTSIIRSSVHRTHRGRTETQGEFEASTTTGVAPESEVASPQPEATESAPVAAEDQLR